MRYIRRAELLTYLGECSSTLDNRITAGSFPPPVKVGARSVAWPDYEIDALMKALLAGASATQLQVLVTGLVELRKRAWQLEEQEITNAVRELLLTIMTSEEAA